MDIDKISNETQDQGEVIQKISSPIEKLYSELKKSLNTELLKKNLSIQIEPFINLTQDKIEIRLDKFLQENLQQYLQMEKKQLSNALLETARKAFANFLYYLTLQQKATRMATIEAESFLKYFLISGNSNYHFHIDKKEYFVNIVEFIADPIQDIQEDNTKIKKYKKSIIDISALLQKLQEHLLKKNELAAEKVLLEIKAIVDNAIILGKENISTKDLLTIQRLQTELTTEGMTIQSENSLTKPTKVSPITIRNNPRVPTYQKSSSPIIVNSSEIKTEKNFVRQLKKLFQ